MRKWQPKFEQILEENDSSNQRQDKNEFVEMTINSIKIPHSLLQIFRFTAIICHPNLVGKGLDRRS